MKSTINTTSENRAIYCYQHELNTADILNFDPTDISNILSRKDIFKYITDYNKDDILHELAEHILYMGTSQNELIALHNYMFSDYLMGDSISVHTQHEFYDYVEKQGYNNLGIIEYLAEISFDLSSCPIGDNDIFVIDTYAGKTYFQPFYEYFENIADIMAQEILTNAENESMSVQEYIDLAISEGTTTIDCIPCM